MERKLNTRQWKYLKYVENEDFWCQSQVYSQGIRIDFLLPNNSPFTKFTVLIRNIVCVPLSLPVDTVRAEIVIDYKVFLYFIRRMVD